jgi:hypothetical protein
VTAAVVRLHGADPRADGVARVGVDELEAKLGPTATHVWNVLRRLRDHYGSVHATVRGISRARGFVRVAPRAVQKALCRLREAALVRDVGWSRLQVPVRRKRGVKRVFVREVFGEHVLDNTRKRTTTDWKEPPRWVYVVPLATERWLQTACVWGGRRVGAGRKAGTRNDTEKNQEGSVAKESRGIDEEITVGMSSESKARVPSYGGDGASAPAEVDGVGVVLGNGSPRQPFLLAEPVDGVPPYPDLTTVSPAAVPPPPLLDADAEDRTLVEELLTAYRHAVGFRTGKPCHVLRRGDVQRSRYYKTLVRAARLMVEHELPPAAWALFMCDVHRDYTKNARGDRPALPWVYSTKRIAQWRGWFGKEAPTYGGGRLVYGKRLRTLLRRYEAMRRELHRTPEADVSEIVAKHFPPHDSYAQAISAARQESASLRERYELRMARGEMLWG